LKAGRPDRKDAGTRIIRDALEAAPERWSVFEEGFRRRDADGSGRDDRAPEEVAQDWGAGNRAHDSALSVGRRWGKV